MSIFNNFLDRSRKLELGSYSDNFSRKGYNWEDIKKQMLGAPEEKPVEPKPADPAPSTINRENSWSFFNNPRSEWEDRRKRMMDDYKKEMQVKFQEKTEKDKRQRFSESNQNNFHSPDRTKEYSQSLRTDNSQLSFNTFESPSSYKVEYYSPQVKSKFSPENRSYVPQAGNLPKDNFDERNSQRSGYPVSDFKQIGANLTYEQSRSLREKQLEEWRRSVQTQLEERNKQKEEAKSRKLLEDKLEEAKVKREVEELNKRHQKEIRFEAGIPLEDHYEEAPIYENPRPKPKALPKAEEYEVYPIRQQVSIKKTRVQDDYRVRHEIVLQEAGIRDIIHQIKSEASHAAAERQEIIQDLERMKFELKNTRIFDPFSYSVNNYRPSYQDNSKYTTFKSAGNSIVQGAWGKQEELRGESKYFTKMHKKEYYDIENQDAVNQLEKLDKILLTQIEETEEFPGDMQGAAIVDLNEKFGENKDSFNEKEEKNEEMHADYVKEDNKEDPDEEIEDDDNEDMN